MTGLHKHKRLKKELRLLDVYAIATGATLSAGFFLLPGIAAVEAGPALVLAYLIAAIPLVPAMFSIIELATAMPRAGGVYYFLDRSLGPFFGTIGGIGTWLALILKVAFALVGMGAYIALYFPDLQIVPVAVGIALFLGGVNILGAKKTGGFQVVLVFGLLAILAIFLFDGALAFEPAHFRGFFDAGFDAIMATAGMVYISYVGVTKVASLSEEVQDPEKNLPRGVILALITAVLVYALGTSVIVGLVPPEELAGNLTPVATAAGHSMGPYGALLLSVAALLAFVSVANAGLMSASRYPLAMSRDHLLPSRFRRLSRFGTPLPGILVTLATVVLIIVLFDPLRIAKLASAFQLLMFALVCVAVIVMRESQITSYDPGYKSPWYPWMQIVGVIAPFVLILKMGALPILFSTALIVVSTLWYVHYGRARAGRSGAIYHLFERLGRNRHAGLDSELRGILREKGLREEDPFDEIVSRSTVFDIDREVSFEKLVRKVAHMLRTVVPLPAEEIENQILEGTRIGATPVSHGVALPHFRSDRIEQPEMVLVRSKRGILMTAGSYLSGEEEEVEVKALFFLVSPDSNPAQHLRILARIAEKVDDEHFRNNWEEARNDHELRESLCREDRFLSLSIKAGRPTEAMIDQPLSRVDLPQGCLVVLLSRGSRSFTPNGSTLLEEGDRLAIIGDGKALSELKAIYKYKRGG